MGTEWCTDMVRYVSGYLGEWLLTYAGTRGEVEMWRKYHSKSYKLSANMTIQ